MTIISGKLARKLFAPARTASIPSARTDAGGIAICDAAATDMPTGMRFRSALRRARSRARRHTERHQRVRSFLHVAVMVAVIEAIVVTVVYVHVDTKNTHDVLGVQVRALQH